MDGFVSVDICDLHRAENSTVSAHASLLKTIIYTQISTGIKQEGSKSKTGSYRGNKDYESAALTIELRAQIIKIKQLTQIVFESAFLRLWGKLYGKGPVETVFKS